MAKILVGRTLSSDTDSVMVAGTLVAEDHDYLAIAYNSLGKISTVTYRLGGAGGTLVATLTLAYTAGRLTSIAKT